MKGVNQNIKLAPLAVFRITFGLLMAFSTLRFWLKGWIYDFYIQPAFHFKYFGFEWVKAVDAPYIYAVFALMFISAIGIALGWFYRLFASLFFLAFTYVELLDVANYLNHYYFVSLVSFILILLPANRLFSLDVRLGRVKESLYGHKLYVNIIRLLLGLVYFYAGIAKLNPDWLLEAMPLRVWLPARADLPLIGSLMDYSATAYIFSWFGALYDLSVPFFLWNKKTRPYAFLAVIAFHILTWTLFPIGVFPWVMIFSTLIFFSDSFHEKILKFLQPLFKHTQDSQRVKGLVLPQGLKFLFSAFLIIQILLPWRFLAYPGDLFWTEQGYRFSWRVMLMEKAGYVTYRIEDPETGRKGEIQPSDFLTPNQEKQLGTQPDLILQFAHFLEIEYQKKGIKDPKIYADAYANLQTRGSKRLIDPTVDLTEINDGFAPKSWILANE